MRKYFYISLFLFVSFQILHRLLIMPVSFFQGLDSVEYAHFLSYYKTYIDLSLILIIVYTGFKSWKRSYSISIINLLILFIASFVYYFFNYVYSAEHRYLLPQSLIFETKEQSVVDLNQPIIGVEINGEAKAYPVPFIRYHHQVYDTLGGVRILVTYCGICRTGRVYEPVINSRQANFRLVGVIFKNAVLEDNFTKSWWSQETGVCIAGEFIGMKLKEIHCKNMELGTWINLYESGSIMQPDPAFSRKYRYKEDDYDTSKIPDETDTVKGNNWTEKSFIVGITHKDKALAIPWGTLINRRIINDEIGNTYFVAVVGSDEKSFAVFERPSMLPGQLRNDTLYFGNRSFNLLGKCLDQTGNDLVPINAYREYWFSWEYAYPHTQKLKE